MGVNGFLTRSATARVSVLVIETPGWSRARCAVEAELRRRGWRAALSPADADALLVCGSPGARMQAAVDLVWDQLPGPRARAIVPATSAAPSALNGIRADLADDDGQRRDAAERSTDQQMGTPAPRSEAPPEHGDMDHGDMDHGDMDHGDMDMPTPGGIPLAGGADDRDGLEMDVLHLPLGPVLPVWPAGLLLRCTVAGDVVIEAEAEVLEPGGAAPADEFLVHGSSPDRLDRAARLLTLTGWGAAATAAARLRDELLLAPEPKALLPQLDRLARRVGRSRLLHWSVSGRGRQEPLDAFACLLALFRDARAALTGAAPAVGATTLDELGGQVVGRQLSSVRLIAAAAELDPVTLVRAGAVGR